MSQHVPLPSLEAKIVVLGSQSVGKTSLVHRYVQNSWIDPRKVQSTVGASFLTTKVADPESGTTIRLQIWDTAGQERFRSISRLYYRGAHAAILCYDITSKKSFDDMGLWLRELRENCGTDDNGQQHQMILHVVGTKADVVAERPAAREVPFERCIGYIAEQMHPENTSASATPGLSFSATSSAAATPFSGGQESAAWDCCHEVSAKSGEGVDEIFRVVTRKLIEQHTARTDAFRRAEDRALGRTPGAFGAGEDGEGGASGPGGSGAGYFDLPHGGNGSFRLTNADKRRSWLGALATPGGLTTYTTDDEEAYQDVAQAARQARCC